MLLVYAFGTAYGQRPAIELTFTGIRDTSYFQPGSIKVKNLTQGGDTILYYPDTVLVLNYVGLNENPGQLNGFLVMQNFPNPVTDRATIGVYVPKRDKVSFTVTDVLGHRIISLERMLEKGIHSFLFTPADESLYLFAATWKGTSRTIKILNSGLGSARSCSLEYAGVFNKDMPLKSSAEVQEFPFSPGDMLMFIGYADTLESGFIDSPETSQDYVFQFATNIPCPGLDSLLYEGQWYHTIQVGGQCWLKENLNVGEMIPGSQTQSNNGTIEKYCYVNSTAKCDDFGGLYCWQEMMQYSTGQGARGICPEGWHIPTDEEIKVLEGMVDSSYPIGHQVWNQTSWRGEDAGKNLKSTYGWNSNGNGMDIYGYRLLSTGYWYAGGFSDLGEGTTIFSSTVNNNGLPYYRGFNASADGVLRAVDQWNFGSPARCIRD